MVDTVPYGSWPSPLSAEGAAAAAPRLEGAAFVGDEIWWGQSVPEEGGRITVLRRTATGEVESVLPAPWNARSSVHEYGGGAWAHGDGVLFFVERGDGRVWALTPGDPEPHALTPAAAGVRYGGLRWQHGTLLAVEEDESDAEITHTIVRISPGGALEHLVSGSDFVAQPALSPDRTRLAWVAWNNPDMPWDRTEVRVATLDELPVTEWESITSGASSALQPEWDGPDALTYLDDVSDRWNIWRRELNEDAPEQLVPADADTGDALWVLGTRWYAPLTYGARVAVRTSGTDEMVLLHADGTQTAAAVPPRARLVIEDTSGDRILFSGIAQDGPGVWVREPDGTVVRIAGGAAIPAEWMPRAQQLTVSGRHGDIHAYAYPPTSPVATGPSDKRPPYLVLVHGGPTARSSGVADSRIAYFTSRGIGVLEVDYGGSTGYGRAYRERLRGQWGIVDVDDVIDAAQAIAAAGIADPARLAIDGGSAGGWTVLGALTASTVFRAGISRYGVGDARALAEATHGFEAHYLDGLIGPLPDAAALYEERSPLGRLAAVQVPILLLQGADDTVVPPAQAEAIRDALAVAGIPHAFVLYDGEGHGFRRAETIAHALQTQLAFLGQVFAFDPPGVAPLTLQGRPNDQRT